MDKKAHIYLSKFELSFLENTDAKKFKKSIMLGNLLPDLEPSFINVKHNLENTSKKVENLMQNIFENFEKLTKTFVLRIGELFHYICDYFTYPHNPELWTGNLVTHIKYELKQHKELKKYILFEEYKADILNFEFNQNVTTTSELFVEILNIHNKYLKEIPEIKNDCKYVVSVIYNVLRWFLNKLFNIEIQDAVNYPRLKSQA